MAKLWSSLSGSRQLAEHSRIPLHGWVLLTGFSLAISILVAMLWVALNDRTASLGNTKSNAELLARVLVDQSVRTVETGELALRTVATLPALLAVESDATAAEGMLAQMLVGTPFFREAAVLDRHGHVLASTTTGNAGLLVDLERLGVSKGSGKEALGPLIAGRGLADVSLSGGAQAVPRGLAFIPVSVAFVSAAGRPLFVVGLVNPDYLANLQVLALGDVGWRSALVRYDGSILSASSAQDAVPGRSFANLAVFSEYLPAKEFGSYIGAGIGGERQVLAFRTSRRQPLIAIVEVPYAIAQERWVASVRAFAGLGAVAIGLVLGLTVLASRSVRSREAARGQADVAKAQSQRQERELAALMQSIQELIFRTDPSGVLTLVNAHWSPLSGRRAEDAIGRSLRELIEPEDQGKIDSLFAPADAIHARTAHVRLRMGPDRMLQLDVAVVPLRVDDKLVGFAGSAVDVTERWVAEQRLQAQLALQDRLLETNPLPISLTDRDGRLLQVNRAWEVYKGRTRQYALGKTLGEVLPEHEAAVHQHADLALLTSGGETSFETVVSHGDGSRRDTRVIKTVVPDENGRVIGILCTLMDISEFRAAERATREARDAAEEAYRAKSEFIANMSHELRTPLQSIIGFSELGVLRGQQSPKLAGMFEDIHNSGQRMLALVNDLLDVSKLESTVGTFHLERVDLRSLIHPIVRELQPLLAKAQLHLDVRLANVPLIAKADPLRFQQVIRNVLANAIKVSQPGQTIELDGHHDAQGYAHVVIRDHGPGVPEGELETIFEAFVQSSKTKDGSGGTGLGLAICRKIVEALGGRIYARNPADGGAAFHVVLPARSSMETVPASL